MSFCEKLNPRGKRCLNCPDGRQGEVAKIVCSMLNSLIIPPLLVIANNVYEERVRNGDSTWSTDEERENDVRTAEQYLEKIKREKIIEICTILDKRDGMY